MIKDMTNEDYHNHDSVSKSSLALMKKSPAHYKASLEEEFKQTPAMKLGTIVHSAILEPDLFEEQYVVAPKFNMRTKIGKADSAAFAKKHEGKMTITMDELFVAMDCSLSVRKHKSAAKLLESGVAETSFFWEKKGVNMRCRPDWLIEHDDGSVTIVDVKTSSDGSPFGFKRAIGKFSYDLQQAIYAEGVSEERPVRGFIFLVVEPFAPFAVSTYRLSDQAMDYATEQFGSLIDLYNQCVLFDDWPAYSEEIEEIDLLRWS